MPEVLSKGKIRLELLPWVSETCGFKKPGRLILDESIEEGATTGTLLRKIAAEHPAFADNSNLQVGIVSRREGRMI